MALLVSTNLAKDHTSSFIYGIDIRSRCTSLKTFLLYLDDKLSRVSCMNMITPFNAQYFPFVSNLYIYHMFTFEMVTFLNLD